jgi:DNA-binding transcriptional LysR family regulator
MGPDLRQLRYFLAVAEAGSLSAAARRLYITQPALSLALGKLEEGVGVKLFTRHARGVELTAAGEVFAEKARLALELIDDATLSARQAAGPPSSELIVGSLPATFSGLPRDLVSMFQSQHGPVTIRLRELSYITHTDDLIAGRVDLAFLWPPYREPRLQFLELSREPRVLGMSSRHPLAGRESVTLDEILDLRYPGFHPACSGGWFDSWFFGDQRGAPAATTDDESATPFEMAFTVQQGRAIAPAAQSFAAAFPAVGVNWVAIADAPPATLALTWNPLNDNPATHAFVRLARAVAGAGLTTPEPSGRG